MSLQPQEPFHESDLDSADYRDRLMRKLNCLIAVLEVASAKVKRSLNGPEPDVERLGKIQNNLTSTLEVCRRARRALERREALPQDFPTSLGEVVGGALPPEPADHLPIGARFEMSSASEHARFRAMGKIDPSELSRCDLEELTRQLQA